MKLPAELLPSWRGAVGFFFINFCRLIVGRQLIFAACLSERRTLGLSGANEFWLVASSLQFVGTLISVKFPCDLHLNYFSKWRALAND